VERCLACEADGRDKVFNSREKAQKAQKKRKKISRKGATVNTEKSGSEGTKAQ